jgi:hypothetical protein
MDKKLEGRKQELRLRQEKARLMAANIDLDAAVSAHGKMSAEEERLMMEKLKKISQEAAEIRSSRVRAQAEADAAEAEFNSLRFAAGVQQPPAAPNGAAGGGAGAPAAAAANTTAEASRSMGEASMLTGGDGEEADGAENLVYTDPDPDAIINRFAALEMEMKQIEAQVSDYTSRLKTLRSRHNYLQSVKQPTARDARDEVDNDLTTIDRLTQKGELAKRALDTAKDELKEAENVKMQLQQSIAMLTQCVSERFCSAFLLFNILFNPSFSSFLFLLCFALQAPHQHPSPSRQGQDRPPRRGPTSRKKAPRAALQGPFIPVVPPGAHVPFGRGREVACPDEGR